MRLFQSTLPRRERLYLVSVVKLIVYFNPRSHEGSDKILHILHNIISIFQSTLPRRERPRLRRMPLVMYNFNPRSHEGSDEREFIDFDLDHDFNPRSHEGSDSAIRVTTKSTILFQSTLPRRERQCHPRYDKIHNIISIHAPTKGATSSVALWTIRTMYFNPRSHEGSDVTSPSAQLFLLYFNPRSHEGSDDSLYGIFQSRPQFQSTLPRRERHSWKTFLMVSFPFQSTLPRRERLVLLC